MIKFINWLSFIGSVIKTSANSLKELVPAWKDLKESNEKEKFWSENLNNNK